MKMRQQQSITDLLPSFSIIFVFVPKAVLTCNELCFIIDGLKFIIFVSSKHTHGEHSYSAPLTN